MNDMNSYEDDFMLNPITVGDTVPDTKFNVLYKGKEEEKSFSDFKGKMIVLFFYPADFTFICPKELEEMAALEDDFKKENTQIISISTDTVYTHKAWLDKSEALKNLKFPMASDANHYLSYMFGVLIEEEGLARRASIILDKDRCVKSIEINDNSIGRSAQELIRKVRAIKFMSEHGEKVCPPQWEKEGDDTLTPGMDLVGNI